MTYKVNTKSTCIGQCELMIIDDSMGVATDMFSPSEEYESIKPIIVKLMQVMGVTGDQSSESELQEAYKERDELELTVTCDSGYKFTPSAVHIVDLEADFPDEGITIELLGFSQQDRKQLEKIN